MKSISKFIFLITLSVSFFSCITVFRHFDFPEPDGLFSVGTIQLGYTSIDRDEIYTKDPNDKRRIMIQIWYPVDKADTEGFDPVLYGDEIVISLNKLGKKMEYLKDIPTRTYEGVPISKAFDDYPVLVYSPGNNSIRQQSTVQISSIVSKGYIVVGVDHPFTSGIVRFPDGSEIFSGNQEIDISDWDEAKHVLIRANDTLDALDVIEQKNSDSKDFLFKKIDTNRIGAFGVSLGGATVLQAASMDDRIKAVFSEEGGVWGSVTETGISVPLMYLQASETLSSSSASFAPAEEGESAEEAFERFVREFRENLNSVYDHSTGDKYYLLVNGFMHTNFSDAPLYSDLLAGDIKYDRSLDIINNYLSAFFNYYLYGSESELLEGNSEEFPEIEFSKNQDISL